MHGCVYTCVACVYLCVLVCGWVWVGVAVAVGVCVSMCMSSKCMFSEPLLLGSPVAPLPAQQQGELPSLADLYVQTESLQLGKLN